ncbi:MAG TPA: acetylxylan esterase [Microlunatus sp.]
MFDLPLAELEDYHPELDEPEDLEEFWRRSLTETRAHDLQLSVRPVANKLAVIDTFDVTFAGWAGTPVRAWLHVPAGRTGPLPTVVSYYGYSGGRGFPHEDTMWAQAGWAQLIMDTRGQGWRMGGPSMTPDWAAEAGLNHPPGFLTIGITDPETFYYRRVYGDAMRMLDVVAGLDVTDPDRVIVTGVSQGGGLTLAVAGLAGLFGVPLLGAAPDVPFLCHFRRAVEITDTHPYVEITEYLAGWRDHTETAYRTLSYFDTAILGRYAATPALFSVALMDAICPPSTVFAAFNAYGLGDHDSSAEPGKQINVYPHNGHEGGGPYQIEAQLDWFAELFAD